MVLALNLIHHPATSKNGLGLGKGLQATKTRLSKTPVGADSFQMRFSSTAPESVQYDDKQFFAAADKGDLVTLTTCIQAGKDINTEDAYGRRALHLAASNGNVDTLQLLLSQHGIEPNVANTHLETPLIVATLSKKEPAVQFLSSHSGVNLDCQDEIGNTALNTAIFHGHRDIARFLISKRELDINLPNYEGFTPFMWAASLGYSKLIEAFLHRKDLQLNTQNIYGETAALLALNSGHEALAKRILSSPGINKETLNQVHQWASQHGKAEMTQFVEEQLQNVRP